MSAVNVEHYIKSVPRKDRHKLDMVVDFEEEDEDGYLIEEHLYEISLVMDSWEGEVAKQLELGRKTQTAIKKKHGSLDDQKLAALREWRQDFGEEATYKKLIECFLKADKPDWADAVCDLFRDHDAAPPPSTGTTMLGEDHFSEVRDLLWSTRSQYTNLGFALNIPAGTMTSIPRSNFYQVTGCYDAVLLEVLKRGVTQEELAVALESRQLKYEQLAQKVRDHTFKTSSPQARRGHSAPCRTSPSRGQPPRHSYSDTSRKAKPTSPPVKSSSARGSGSPSSIYRIAESTDDPSIDFSELLGRDKLAKWLLQKFGPDYKEEIDKLKSEGINGRLFLQLPSKPKLMKEIGLSAGFRSLISDEVDVLSPSTKAKEGKVNVSSTAPSHCDEKSVPQNSSPKPKKYEVNSSSTAPSKDNFNSSSAAIASDEECVSDNNLVCAILANISDVSESSGEVDANTRSAFVPKDVAWFGCTELVVKVTKEMPPGWTYHGYPLNIGNIMSWANEWKGDNIPEFRLARPGEPAQVRVEFNNSGIRCSYIGTRAQSRLNTEPTMWLDLHTGGVTDAYKKHIVVHEFGHILGLTHEHQRSDFWKHVRSYIDTDKMKKDLKISNADFRHDWEADNWDVGEVATDYDPSSVMHYWFKPSWLTEGYSKLSNIAKDKSKGKLSLSAAKILTGIHHFCKHPVDKPSKLDIHLLSVVYYQQSNAPVDEESQKTQELNFPVMSTPDSSNKEAKETSNTLAFYYESGEMPFNEAVSSLKGLKDGGLSWHPIQRDNEKAMFRVNKAFDVILTSQSECIEVQVSKVGHGAQLLPEVCISVRETLEKKLRSLNDGKRIYELTFKCTCDQYRCIDKQSESPPKQRLMKVLESETGPPTTAECLCIPLDRELSKESHLIWFAPRFKDFHDQKNGKLTIFENDLSFFLSKEGKELVRINPEIDEKVKVDLSRAYVRDRRQHDAPSEKVVRTSLPFPNTSDEVLKEVWSFTTTYEKGVEHSKMEFKKLSINAELAPCIEVMETGGGIGSVGVGYEKGTEITHTVHEMKSEEVEFNREVRIPPKSTVIVKQVTITKSFECQVERIDVSFNPKSKVKCTVRRRNDTEEKKYELRQFLRLGGDPIPDKSGTIHRSISVKYEWKEASDEIRFYNV